MITLMRIWSNFRCLVRGHVGLWDPPTGFTAEVALTSTARGTYTMNGCIRCGGIYMMPWQAPTMMFIPGPTEEMTRLPGNVYSTSQGKN